jgi:hypothetical protein
MNATTIDQNPIYKRKRKTIGITLPPHIYEELLKYEKDTARDHSSAVEFILKEYLNIPPVQLI